MLILTFDQTHSLLRCVLGCTHLTSISCSSKEVIVPLISPPPPPSQLGSPLPVQLDVEYRYCSPDRLGDGGPAAGGDWQRPCRCAWWESSSPSAAAACCCSPHPAYNLPTTGETVESNSVLLPYPAGALKCYWVICGLSIVGKAIICGRLIYNFYRIVSVVICAYYVCFYSNGIFQKWLRFKRFLTSFRYGYEG